MTYFYHSPVFKNYVEHARELLKCWHREGKNYLIYGAGIHSQELLKCVKPESTHFLGFIDQSIFKQKEGFLGFPVYPVESIENLNVSAILISSYEYQGRIKERIQKFMGTKVVIGALYKATVQKDHFSKIFECTPINTSAIKKKKTSMNHKRRKIAVVDSFFSWPPIGGCAVDLASVMNHLTFANYDVTFFLPLVDDDFYFPRGRLGRSEGLKFDVINIPFLSSQFNLNNFTEKMAEAVEEYNPEFLFMGDMYAFKPYLAERLRKYKIIWRSYAYDLVCPRCNLLDNRGRSCPASLLTDPERCKLCVEKDRNINWDHPIFREIRMAKIFSKEYHDLLVRNIEKAHYLIIYNDILKNRIEDCFHNLDNVLIRPSGIDPKQFSIKRTEKNIKNVTFLFAGRGEDPAKGLEFFLKIFRKLREKHSEIRFLVTGKFDFAEKGIESVGWIPQEQMPDLFKRADICVVPSLWEEPFGIVAVEAMAAGVPVIASEVGGLKQIIRHGETGYLIPPGDCDGFFYAANLLIENSDMRQEMGEKGQSLAKEYSWEKVMEKYENVFV